MSATATTPRRSPTQQSRRIVTGATVVSVTAALAAIAGQFLLPGGWAPLQVGVLVTGLLLGLPHGATDHLVLLRQATRRSLWVIVPAYAAAAMVIYAAFRAWPVPAVAGFAVISGWHFATGEAQFAALRTRPGTVMPVLLALGGAVIVLPAAAHPAGVRDVLLAVMDGHEGAHEVVHAAATLHLLVLIALSVLIAAGLCILAAQRRWLDAGELCLLATLFAVVPPLAAFGVYFGCWHSVRHIARLLTDEPPLNHTTDHVSRRISQFARDAALPTAAALVVVALLRWHADSWLSFLATDLAVLAGLTVPHMLVVAGQDRMLTRTN